MPEKKSEKKTPRKKKSGTGSTGKNTIIVPERELKDLFDYTLERARAITKKYKE